jgi:hypothetical protein
MHTTREGGSSHPKQGTNKPHQSSLLHIPHSQILQGGCDEELAGGVIAGRWPRTDQAKCLCMFVAQIRFHHFLFEQGGGIEFPIFDIDRLETILTLNYNRVKLTDYEACAEDRISACIPRDLKSSACSQPWFYI